MHYFSIMLSYAFYKNDDIGWKNNTVFHNKQKSAIL